MKNNKIIFNDSFKNHFSNVFYSFSPRFNYYVVQDNGLYICNTTNKTKKALNIVNFRANNNQLKVVLFSPDEKKFAYIAEDNKYKYICIYDIDLSKTIDTIPIGKGKLTLSQWHQSNKLLYQYNYESFIVNTDGTNRKLLGKYMFNPLLSPDAKYLVYSRPGCGYEGESLFDIEEYRYEDETGLYILDLESNEIQKLPLKYDGQMLDQIPVCWFEVPHNLDTSQFNITLDKQKSFNITSTMASSTLILNGMSYNHEYAFDGLKETAWAEGIQGDGKGEWIKIAQYTMQPGMIQCYEAEQTVSGIKIINGYAKTKETYFNNNRVKRVKIELSDGSQFIEELDDNNLDFQTIEFKQPIKTKYVKIFILDSYKGKKYTDTCISEIKLLN